MKTIHKLLICCVLLLFSCQVERIDQSNDLSDNIPDQETENSDEEDECETFFAYGDETNAICFLEDGFNRWGWTIGPLTSGAYTFDLYSGAGQCDLDKGTLVGSLTLNYDEATGTAEVTFEMLDGFVMSETHLYIGSEPYPTGQNGNPTVAPGQFPYQHELDAAQSDSYTISDLSGEIYIIAHGEVCPDDGNDDDDDNGGDDGGGGAF